MADYNGNGGKALAAWLSLMFAALLSLAASVGNYFAHTERLNQALQRLDRIEERLLYLERKP